MKFASICHMFANYKFAVTNCKLELSNHMAYGIIINDVEVIRLTTCKPNVLFSPVFYLLKVCGILQWDLNNQEDGALFMARKNAQAHVIVLENASLLNESTAL